MRFTTAHLAAIAQLMNKGSFHGEALVLACAGADNVATCDRLLERAESAGLIERGLYEPSRQQAFFNVNGDRSASHHHWITVTQKYLVAQDLVWL